LRPLRRIPDFAAKLGENSLVRIAFSSLGLALVYLLWVVRPVVDPQQHGFYHWGGPARNFYFPYLLIILAVWLLVAGLLLLARNPGRMRVAIWTPLLLCISCVLIKFNIFYHRFDSETMAFYGAVTVTLLLTIAWRPSFAERFERVLAPITTILIFLGILGAFILCQLSWYELRASSFADGSTLHHRDTVATIQPHRIIWIVFDELSYQQTYEHRYPGLQLPAFDALAAHSTVFTNATPFYIFTEVVLPGLFAGKPFDKIRSTPAREPLLHSEVTGRWQTFNQHDTVFQDALNAGYSTALAGWDNPYCRIIAAVLDSCYWAYHRPWNNMLPSETVLFNTRVLAAESVPWVLTILPDRVRRHLLRFTQTPTRQSHFISDQESHIQDYLDLDARSDQLLRDRSYSFVLLHLPVPHPEGIYDRRSGTFSMRPTSYLDNLALADKCLAGILQTLKQTGQLDSSTIVLMGDHGWRTIAVWRTSTAGTPEEKIASNSGQYDPRTVYLVKLPNQTTSAHIDAPYQTVNTRKLFDAVMSHQINTPADLSTWAHTTH
jgi:Sulfatase